MRLDSAMPCAEGYVVRSYRCVDCRVTSLLIEAGAAGDASVLERRAVPRHPVTTGGTIESGRGAIACVVRNVSAAGAGLDATGCGRLPRQFTLMAGGSHLPCHVIWHRAKRIGIAFD